MAVLCVFHLIVISSTFAYTTLYEATGTNVWNAKTGPKYTVFYILCKTNQKYLPQANAPITSVLNHFIRILIRLTIHSVTNDDYFIQNIYIYIYKQNIIDFNLFSHFLSLSYWTAISKVQPPPPPPPPPRKGKHNLKIQKVVYMSLLNPVGPVGQIRGYFPWVFSVGQIRGSNPWVFSVGIFRGCFPWVFSVGYTLITKTFRKFIFPDIIFVRKFKRPKFLVINVCHVVVFYIQEKKTSRKYMHLSKWLRLVFS